jgi:hypothetical protein
VAEHEPEGVEGSLLEGPGLEDPGSSEDGAGGLLSDSVHETHQRAAPVRTWGDSCEVGRGETFRTEFPLAGQGLVRGAGLRAWVGTERPENAFASQQDEVPADTDELGDEKGAL